MSSNISDYSEKDNLKNTIKSHLEMLKVEIRSLKSKNCTLTSRLFNLDDISDGMNILKAENLELKNTNQDMLNKFFVLEKQTLDTSAQSSLIISEHSVSKKELEKYKSIVEKFTFSFEKLNMLLKDQRAIFNHARLGYKPLSKQRTIENLFIKFVPEQ